MTEPTILEGFKKALFDAFVWTQAAENQVRRLTPGLDDKCSFFRRIESLRPRICEDGLYWPLHLLRERRNAVVHESDYINTVLASGSDESLLPCGDDIKLLEEVTQLAVDLHAVLLEIDEELPPAADRPALNPTASS